MDWIPEGEHRQWTELQGVSEASDVADRWIYRIRPQFTVTLANTVRANYTKTRPNAIPPADSFSLIWLSATPADSARFLRASPTATMAVIPLQQRAMHMSSPVIHPRSTLPIYLACH